MPKRHPAQLTVSQLIAQLKQVQKNSDGFDLPVFLGASADHPLTAEQLVTYDTPVWGYFRLGIGPVRKP